MGANKEQGQKRVYSWKLYSQSNRVKRGQRSDLFLPSLWNREICL